MANNEKAFTGLYEQDEVNYSTLSRTRNQACANCRWFMAGTNQCHLVESTPQPILPTGYCDEWTEQQAPESEDDEPLLEQLMEAMSGVEPMAKEHKPEVNRLAKMFKELGDRIAGKQKARDEPFPVQGFKSIGNGKWVGWWTNNFEDREGEYFPNHAIDDYIARVDSGHYPMPELRYWHYPVRLGEAKSLARIALDDRLDAPSFVISVGEYDDTPLAKAFEKSLNETGKRFKMSHGFYYPDSAKEHGVYHVFQTFEQSILPDYAAANPYTSFGDVEMPVLGDTKRKELVGLIGEDMTRKYEQEMEARAKELSAQGVGHKDIEITDPQARAEIKELASSVKELVDLFKAEKAFPPKKAEDDEDKDAKMDKLYGARKKELEDLFTSVNKQFDTMQTQLNGLAQQVKEFDSLTPRRAARAPETQVNVDDPAFKELQDNMNNQATQAKKEFSQIFGAVFPNTNGTGG